MSERYQYHRPEHLQEAQAVFDAAEEARYLAGGMTLLPTIRQNLLAPDGLIDLSQAVGRAITFEAGILQIEAMATHDEVATNHLVKTHLPALSALASGIGDRQVRKRGTIGGSVANNDPAACYPAALLALEAVIITTNRAIPADAYFVDLFETALQDGELITAIHFAIDVSKAQPAIMAGYCKAPNPASRYALVGVFIACQKDKVRVAVTGAGEAGVFLWDEAGQVLADDFSEQALASLSVSEDGLMSDIHASAAFRAYMMKTMAQKALRLAAPIGL